MLRKLVRVLSVVAIALTTACGGSGITDLNFPSADLANTGTSAVSAQVLNLSDGVPDGRRITFLGDEITMRGDNFRSDMHVFFGANLPIQHRPNSLFTTPRHLLPNAPFVYIDPATGERTQTEMGVNVEFSTSDDVIVSIPPVVACTGVLTNPTLRFYGEDGSSFPTTDVLHVVGPLAIALTPNKIPDIGGDSVIVHGDFFSVYTQIGFRYNDPVTGEEITVGLDAQTDIQEIFIDRHTLIIPAFPGIVPNSTVGLAKELKVTILVHENIEEITSNPELEPALLGRGACFGFTGQSEIPVVLNGVRNSQRNDALTFLPTGVTDYPSIAGVLPEWGSEIGGNTVVIHGDQFDGFTVDLGDGPGGDPERPGIRIECPPGSGDFVAPLSAILVDRETIVLKMPACAVEIPSKVDFCLTNNFARLNPAEGELGPIPFSSESNGDGIIDHDCVLFKDIYEYRPIPPIIPPIVSAIHPISGNLETNTGNGYGLQKFLVVGDWFDSHTELNGGFEFVLPDGTVVQSLRTIMRNRNLLEVYTKRLPDNYYPLSESILANVRVRNVVGHRDHPDRFTFVPLEDADGTPVLTEICGKGGPSEGGNQIMVIGDNFDTTTKVLFSGLEATEVQFVNAKLLIATVPSQDKVAESLGDTSTDTAIVTVEDDGEAGNGGDIFTYGEQTVGTILGALDPNTGSSTGGYDILGYGVELTPLTKIEIGEGDGNFSPNVYFLSSNLIRIEVPEAFDAQIGDTVDVGATDPLNGLDKTVKTVEFTYTAAQQAAPEILFVATTVVDPILDTEGVPALNVSGGDRMLIIGRNFDQRTTFDITKPQVNLNSKRECDSVEVLTPNLAVCVSPPSPDGAEGFADLRAHNLFGDSEPFLVEYVKPGPPNIIDVRNLDTGDQTSPIDAEDRLLIFGDNFFDPVQVYLTGCDLQDQETVRTYPSGPEESLNVTRVEDHLLGINIPKNIFCAGPLQIEVVTPHGSTFYETLGDGQTAGEGTPIFQLVGPQPPRVIEVFESRFNSGGGQEAIFYGRNFTSSTHFYVRTTGAEPVEVFGARYVNSEVVLFTMPALEGGMPPDDCFPGSVLAVEEDPTLAEKIDGAPFFLTEDAFEVCNDSGAVLLGVFPDRGSINGGEQVLLLGANFLMATGESNVTAIHFSDEEDDIGIYTLAAPGDLPLDPNDKGKYVILNDHQILLITNVHPTIAADATEAPVTVSVDSQQGSSSLTAGYTYINTPGVITPLLLGVTPNETRLNGGTSHLISGGFLTSVDKLVFSKGATEFAIDATDDSIVKLVTDEFLVILMPDLSSKFAAGDVLDLQAFKTLPDSTVLESNVLHAALKVTFAGPPTINSLGISPNDGSAFGGTVVKITGSLFTNNSQVLFGTIPARTIVVANPTTLYAVAPNLPVSAPAPGVALDNLGTGGSTTIDLAVFTQGGWAVVENGYKFDAAKPVVTNCTPTVFNAGEAKIVTVTGENFVPGNMTVVADEGTVSNILVLGFNTLTFKYTAPSGGVNEVGPIEDLITIASNMGEAADGCELDTNLPAFLASSNVATSPSTGVADGALVVVTIEGGNVVSGGTVTLERGGTTGTIKLTEVTTPLPFKKGGQWMPAADGLGIVFSVPNIFSADTPTLLEGNRNIGPVSIEYKNNLGAATLEDAFEYIPAVLGFEEYSFTTPQLDPVYASLDKLAAGDINADGVPDIAILVRNDSDTKGTNPLTDSDAVIYMADTFGDDVDFNGDGVTPDFAGSYTKTIIANDDFRTHLYLNGRGGIPRLANLDDDDQLEIILPGIGEDSPQILIVDVKSDGTFGDQTILAPSSPAADSAIAGIAVGNFEQTDGIDIAIIVGSDTAADRQIVIFKSTGTDFDFDDVATAIDGGLNQRSAGFLAAGDFDGDGDDDLIWGLNAGSNSPIVVATVDADAGTITDQNALSNVTGGRISSIVTHDTDSAVDGGDKGDEAFVLVEESANGDLVDNKPTQGGVIVILNPIPEDDSSPEGDEYFLTGFINNGRAMDAGDLNGDGIVDLAITSNQGEMIVLTGKFVENPSEDDEFLYSFNESSRSWVVTTVQGFWSSRVHGLAVADLNRDGLAEVFVGDIGVNPMSLIVWLNTSR